MPSIGLRVEADTGEVVAKLGHELVICEDVRVGYRIVNPVEGLAGSCGATISKTKGMHDSCCGAKLSTRNAG